MRSLQSSVATFILICSYGPFNNILPFGRALKRGFTVCIFIFNPYASAHFLLNNRMKVVVSLKKIIYTFRWYMYGCLNCILANKDAQSLTVEKS